MQLDISQLARCSAASMHVMPRSGDDDDGRLVGAVIRGVGPGPASNPKPSPPRRCSRQSYVTSASPSPSSPRSPFPLPRRRLCFASCSRPPRAGPRALSSTSRPTSYLLYPTLSSSPAPILPLLFLSQQEPFLPFPHLHQGTHRPRRSGHSPLVVSRPPLPSRPRTRRDRPLRRFPEEASNPLGSPRPFSAGRRDSFGQAAGQPL